MAQKKITDLQLISSVTDVLNLVGDNGTQTYRLTALQLKNYVLSAGAVMAAALASDSVTTAKILDANVTRAKLAAGAIGNMFIVSKSADYTAVASTDDIILVDASAGNKTITLPAVSGLTGKKFTIKKTDSSANKVIIDGNGTETVEGALTFSLFNQNDVVEIVCTGTAWVISNLNFTKESVVCSTGTATYSQTANTFITAPLTITSDSTRYPISSNTITVRKTAKYRIICRNSFTGVNGEAGYVTYSVNGASESSNWINSYLMDSNASGSTSQITESKELTFTAGDVLRLRTQMATNTRTGVNGRLELMEI